MILHGFASRNPRNTLKHINAYMFIYYTSARPQTVFTRFLGGLWEVSGKSFGGSRSSGLSRGARGVSEAIIAIKHTGLSNISNSL